MRSLLLALTLVLFGCAKQNTSTNCFATSTAAAPIVYSENSGPLRIVVVGLVHGHAEGLLWNANNRDDIELVGIYEPNKDLFDRLASKYNIDPALRYDDLGAMLDETKPEAASVMTSIADHTEAIEACAKRGVHTLVEKPLEFRQHEAHRIRNIALKHGVLVLTNYETSWYASIRHAKRLVDSGEMAPLRRMAFRHGHPGPREIGCAEEFLEWLTDPNENGDGALTDFGCYGVAQAIWMMNGETPSSITANVNSLKPDVYPHVSDDATIVLGFDSATAVIQASWAWTHDNKEVDFHTELGSIHAGKWDTLSTRAPNQPAVEIKPDPMPGDYQNEWTYLRKVVRGECEIDPLSALDLNVTVAEVLDQARREAHSDRRNTHQ